MPTIPDLISYHKHVSERVPGPDFACRWAAGVEFIHDGYDLKVPVNKAEWQALQTASGDTGFSNMGDFRKGVKARYGIDLNPSQVGLAEVKARLTPGRIALLSGKLTKMDAAFRRWYPDFTGGHTVYAACIDEGEYWWCDPGAPKVKPNGEEYIGRAIDWAQLSLFVGGYGYEQIFRDAIILPKPALPPIYTQAQVDAIVASTKAAADVVCNAKVTTAKATADKAGYNSGLATAQAAVTALPRK